EGPVDTHEVLLRSPDGSLLAHYLIAVFRGRWLAGVPRAGGDAAEARFIAATDVHNYPLTEGAAALIERARAATGGAAD
ncbi:MAG TPA: hypothetical protein VG742_19710, partial [Dongiaceae bacterium]|nr:hypothetical protein [Dongiaceae bacterium]